MTARRLPSEGTPNATAPISLPPRTTTDLLDPDVLLKVLAEVKSGDFNTRMPLEWTGIAGKIADALNDGLGSNQSLEHELARVSHLAGQEGKLTRRVALGRSGDGRAGGDA